MLRASCTSRRRSSRRLFASAGSRGRSYSSPIGKSMYFSPPWITPVSGAHPRFVESVVDECDFAEVEIACVLRGEGLGRAVRGVRIIEVNPHESLLALVRSPPTRRGAEDRRRRTLLNHEVEGGLPFSVVVVINIEALIEAKSRIERKRADERTRRVGGAAQHRRDRFVFRIELESGVVAHAMLIGIQTGQYVDV